eukprot:2168349-Prymnesium_polylepis.1
MLNATELLPQADFKSKGAQQLFGSFSLDNVCVRYPQKTTAVADLISRDGKRAEIHGYNEYSRRFRRITTLRPTRADEKLDKCRQRRLGLGLRFSSSNFFHQLYYASAAHLSLIQEAKGSPGAVFVPLGTSFPHDVPDRLWEFTLRSLSNESAADLLNRTQSLLGTPCTCFDRLAAATHGYAFRQIPRGALAAFRSASALHARLQLNLPQVAERSARDMLFILRQGKRRAISNAEEVQRQLLSAQPRIRVLAFEEIPIVQQLAIISEASVLIGVHGMAIAGYVAHLPTDERRTACVELQPAPSRVSWEWTRIVPTITGAAGVRHFPLT